MKQILLLTLLNFGLVVSSIAQQELAGQVYSDTENETVIGANVYLDGTYDGTATSADGSFLFKTTETGIVKLIVSAIGFHAFVQEINLDLPVGHITIRLKEDIKRLDDLVITAGTFEASDKKKAVIINQMDVLTTAGATADIPGVLNTLPGTQTVAEEGKLFVRGGDSEETKTFIDGMLVDQPYSLAPQNVPSRMRFSPFLFSGTTFSTGGYSAEYGQALSGTLILDIQTEPIQTQTDFSIMSVGGAVSHTQKWDRNSVFIESYYTNLKPYISIIPQYRDWKKAPESFENTLVYRNKIGKNGNLMALYNNDFSSMNIEQPSVMDVHNMQTVSLKNTFHHMNVNYTDRIKEHWQVYGGISATLSKGLTDVSYLSETKNINTYHAKAMAGFDNGGWASIRFGLDQYVYNYSREFEYKTDSFAFNGNSHQFLPALFVESDMYFTRKFIGRIGIRNTIDNHSGEYLFGPRLSLAYKTGDFSQVSFASGLYNQRASSDYLLIKDQLDQEQALHLILNYQFIKGYKIFRIEGYHKQYDKLTTFKDVYDFNPDHYSNDGYGYANGIELFWRDGETIRNADYWISYSYTDTKRRYKYYPIESTPGFASAHNLSFVYKHFFQRLNSQAGLTYTFTSGRPYHDPNLIGFQNQTMRNFHDLSMNWSYLIKTNFILHFSMTNILGIENTFGYQFSQAPNEEGHYESIPITQSAKRFIFLGAFYTLSKDRSRNQLKNL